MSDQIRTDDEILDTVAKLLRLKDKAGTPEEAALAAAKADELMVRYNLTQVALERRTGKVDGKRETQAVEGGFYKFQRDLFEAVARLNFCISWSETYVGRMEKDRPGGFNYRSGRRSTSYSKGDPIVKRRFQVVGRVANVAATKGMFNYLGAAVTRALRDRVRQSDGKIPAGAMMDGWAVSFREGAVDRLMSKIYEQRRDGEKKRQSDALAAAKMSGASTSTALTIKDVEEAEWAANYDVVYGEGSWAKRMLERAEAAARRRADEQEMTRLAKEDPEEHRRREAQRRKDRRSEGAGRKDRERRPDPSAYRAGYDAAKEISLHQQVSDEKPLELEDKR